MSLATSHRARGHRQHHRDRRSKDRNAGSLVFLGCLWFSLFFGVMVLLALIVDTAIEGAPRFDSS